MHLKYDHRLFRVLFTGPLIIAVTTLIALLFLFGQLVGDGSRVDLMHPPVARCCCIRRARIAVTDVHGASEHRHRTGGLGALYLWRARQRPANGADESPTPGQRSDPSSPRSSLIFLSLNGPLHDLSDDYLFSAHMVQHLLLTLVVPPLLLVWARRAGCCARAPLAASGRCARWLTTPSHCFVIFNVVIAAWHLPPCTTPRWRTTRSTSSST